MRDNELSRERLREQGESAQLCCQKCDEKFKLWDLLEQKFASSQARQQVQEIETEAKAAIDQDSTELILVGHAVSIAGEAGQLFRQISNHQRGIDGEIEFKDSQGQPSTKRILLLLKPSEFYGHTRRNHKDVFAIADNSLQVYWQKQTCPIMLVYRDDEGKIWWMDINDYLNSPYREEFGDRRASNEIIFNGEPFTALNLLRMRDRLLSPRDG